MYQDIGANRLLLLYIMIVVYPLQLEASRYLGWPILNNYGRGHIEWSTLTAGSPVFLFITWGKSFMDFKQMERPYGLRSLLKVLV